MAITEAASAAEVDALEALLESATPRSVVIQLRAHGCAVRELMARATRLGAMARRAGQLVIVNDRIDVALAAEVDGVHLPGAGVPPREARRLLRAGSWLSRALHAPDELLPEELEVLDAVVISPVISPRKGRDALGLATFGAWAQRCREKSEKLGVYALGGVTAESAVECMNAGATGVAVLGAARDAENARELTRVLGIARERSRE
jgi:thiamine-phosphate pyrophosphorylase